MTGVRITVVPVGLVPQRPTSEDGDEEQLRLRAYNPSGRWLTAELPDGLLPSEVARELLLELDVRGDWANGLGIEPVSFRAIAGKIELVYTAALPLSASLTLRVEEFWYEHWPQLAPWVEEADRARSHLESDAVRQAVLNYWRRQLEETTAIGDFLPRYFTIAQARSTYSSVWGCPQNAGGFYRWFHDALDRNGEPVWDEVDPDDVRAALRGGLERDLQGLDIAEAAAVAAAVTSTTRFVGTNVGTVVGGVIGMVALGAVAPIAMAGAAAAGAWAYQSRATKARPPAWFTRRGGERRLLRNPYASDPIWLPDSTPPWDFH